jgi:uridine kinase
MRCGSRRLTNSIEFVYWDASEDVTFVLLRSDSTPTPSAPDVHTPAPGARVVERVVAELSTWRRETVGVLIVAFDGHGASGKTTIARGVVAATGAALVHTDDFFRERRVSAPVGAAPLADYYDWQALKAQALEPLRAGRPAVFPRRHWEEPESAGRRIVIEPRPVVVLEGVSAAAPALADLVNRRVLVATPEPERLRRLHGRVADEDWDADWLLAEQAYFDSRPASTFDLTVPGVTAPAAAQKGS